jgi:hypothetical protein
MTQFYILIALIISGCTRYKEASDTSDPFGGDDGSAFDDPDSDEGSPDHYGLPDLTEGLDSSGCEVQEATGVAGIGAASYFYGLYRKTDGGWTGYEEWLFYANEAWQEDGGADCKIRWAVTAVETETGSCPDCDLGLSVSFVLNVPGSTCPENMVEAESPTSSEQYDVSLDDGGETKWYFAGSGNPIGEGYGNADALNFLSPKSCRWF